MPIPFQIRALSYTPYTLIGTKFSPSIPLFFLIIFLPLTGHSSFHFLSLLSFHSFAVFGSSFLILFTLHFPSFSLSHPFSFASMAAFDSKVAETQSRMAELEAENQQLRGNQAQENHQFQQVNQQNINLANEASLWRD